MSAQSHVKRLARVTSAHRTDLWPETPQIPQRMVERFPELGQYNDQMRLWAERMRNLLEVGRSDSDAQ